MNNDRELVFDRLKLEALPLFVEVLRKGNPEQYALWQGNCCRQAAVFAYIYCLLNVEGITSAEVYESVFTGQVNGRQMIWQHAWLYFEIGGWKYVFDYPGCSHGARIIKSQYNRIHWGGSTVYKNVSEEPQSRKAVDVHSLLNEPEFYTGRSISAIYSDIMEEMVEA